MALMLAVVSGAVTAVLLLFAWVGVMTYAEVRPSHQAAYVGLTVVLVALSGGGAVLTAYALARAVLGGC